MYNFIKLLLPVLKVMIRFYKSIYFILISGLILVLPQQTSAQEVIGNLNLAVEYFKQKQYDKAAAKKTIQQ